ncbi:K+/H+ antiporter subunit F [Marinospirillum alkaliphilum]|uniref:Multicomponent K+:H+ antiporter subunit F n=1 Tax=Marinospirillum alkaliphilum DSM 21637 TaxID=1122209 RepID=A0A1K1ZFR3_9GAMM|nr:K+/H+ antiporter subunit F [Marinospirillum alkaliphilum]SFX72943.1 multicomponent K+:H+ antiporter subunit F [Marinospirillum alkaliphilum DSM 21637]
MLKIALLLVSGMVCVALVLNLWRLIQGPDIADRILALDTMYINSIALIIIFGMYMGSPLYFEAALLIAMLGFVSTAALCKYLLRGDIIE